MALSPDRPPFIFIQVCVILNNFNYLAITASPAAPHLYNLFHANIPLLFRISLKILIVYDSSRGGTAGSAVRRDFAGGISPHPIKKIQEGCNSDGEFKASYFAPK